MPLLDEGAPAACVLPVGRVLFPRQVASYAVGKRASVALIDHLLDRLGATVGRLHHHRNKISDAPKAIAYQKPARWSPEPAAHAVALLAHAVVDGAELALGVAVALVDPAPAERREHAPQALGPDVAKVFAKHGIE